MLPPQPLGHRVDVPGEPQFRPPKDAKPTPEAAPADAEVTPAESPKAKAKKRRKGFLDRVDDFVFGAADDDDEAADDEADDEADDDEADDEADDDDDDEGDDE